MGPSLWGSDSLLELRKLDAIRAQSASLLRQLGGRCLFGWVVVTSASVGSSRAAHTIHRNAEYAAAASNVVVIIVPPRNTQSPAGRDRGVAPFPALTPVDSTTPSVAENGGRRNPGQLRFRKCRWSIRDREPGSHVDRILRVDAKGGNFESGGPFPCEDESVGP